jgi:hypothetical protein
VLAAIEYRCRICGRIQLSKLGKSEVFSKGVGLGLTIAVNLVHVRRWYPAQHALLNDLGVFPADVLYDLEVLHSDLLKVSEKSTPFP